jgi:integrase
LRFGEAADRWLAGPVADLRPSTQAGYRNAIERHLRPRYATRRLDMIEPDDLAELGRELRQDGKSEATILAVLGALNRVYRSAARRLAWAGTNPVSLMLPSERPKLAQSPRHRIYDGEQLAQTIAAAHEPYRTMFTLAALTGARVSELCGLTWANLRIADADDAEVGRSIAPATGSRQRRTGQRARSRFPGS